MKKTMTIFLAAIFLVLSFSNNTYAYDYEDNNRVCFMGGVLDWFKRIPSDTEPFYKQRGNYIYTGDTLELKEYTIDGTLIIEEDLKTPRPKTSGYYQKRLIINAKEIIITGDISANNYAQLHATKDKNGRGGNIRIEGTGKLTTYKLEDTESKGKAFTVISADGDFLLKDNSKIEMGSGSVIRVNGDFVADSKMTSELQKGIIEIGGSVDLNKKFISKKAEKEQNTIHLIGSDKRVLKGTSDSRIDNLQLDYEALKGLSIKKKLFNKTFFQCKSLFFDYQSHFMPKDIIDRYYTFEEIHGKSDPNNQIIDYAKSFLYTIIYTNKLGKVNINKTFLHVDGKKDEQSSIYTIDIKEKPTSIAIGDKVYQAKITIEFTGVGKPIKMDSAAFARLVIDMQNGETYDYLVVSKIETINEDTFIESLKEGASKKISDLAKDILMDQAISDLLDVSTICEWKKGIVTAKIGEGVDFLQDLDDLLQDWNKMVKGLPEYEGKDIETIQGKEEHVKAAPETIDDSSESANVEEVEVTNAGDASDENIQQYKEFIQSQNDGRNYLIYDIDKDGYPEVMIEKGIPEQRTSLYYLYTYKENGFEYIGIIESPYSHGPAEYASYPNGNGMVESFGFRGKEGVAIITFKSAEVIKNYSYLEDAGDSFIYYQEKYDQVYQDSQNHNSYINHQYYQSENSSAYYENSLLLGQNAMDDYTAIYEAFDTNREDGNIKESEEIIPDILKKAIADYDKLMQEGEHYYNENWPDSYHSERQTYYAIVDIDNNGIDELILRYDNPDQEHFTNKDSGYGETTFIYTIVGSELKLVVAPDNEGYNPEFAHLSFVHVYKGTNFINLGMQHLPKDDVFYSYQNGWLTDKPVLEMTWGGGTWIKNDKESSQEECAEAFNNASNNDEGYEMQLYERGTVAEGDIVEANDKTTDLYEYRYFNIWELANIVGAEHQGDGDGIILGKDGLTIAAFGIDETETNYITIHGDIGYSLGSIHIGDSIESANEKLSSLGFELSQDGMQLYGNPWREYVSGSEKISYHWNTSNNLIEDVTWDG